MEENLRFVNSSKTQKSIYLANKALFFLQMKKNLFINYALRAIWQKSFLAEVIFKLSWINPLNANDTKWSNTLKQFIGNSQQIIWVFLTILWGLALKRLSWVNNIWSDSGVFILDISKLMMILIWSPYYFDHFEKLLTALTNDPLTFHIYALGFPIFGNRLNWSYTYTLMAVAVKWKEEKMFHNPQYTIKIIVGKSKLRKGNCSCILTLCKNYRKVELKYKASLVTVTKTFTQNNKTSNKRVLLVLLLYLQA